MADDRLALEVFLPYRLNRLAEAVSRDFSRIYKERFGLTRPEWRLLATLGQYGTMTATEVGAHSAMHKTKVSRAVTALEKRRWLIRKADEHDRRVERLTLTKAGEAAYREMVPLARAFEERLLEAMNGLERDAVNNGLLALERTVLDVPRVAEQRKKAAVEWILEKKRSGRHTDLTTDGIPSARDESRS